jgi:ribosomal protein L4
LKDHLKALVDKGVITQAQADARLQFMQNQPLSSKGKGGGMWGFGHGMMMRSR